MSRPLDVHHLFIEKKLTLSLAESCTGGLVAKLLTDIPGSSAYFFGSIVAYHDEFKEKFLNVPKELIEAEGAVSSAVAISLCQNLLELTGCDVTAAVTGIAGPLGSTKEKSVGTVWIAVTAKNREPKAHLYHFSGSREEIRDKAAKALFSLLMIVAELKI